jgi:alpha-1,3-rhamnosyl/mannosyltransferase
VAEPATVALVGHRLAEPHPTGVGRYYRELATALAATADPATHRYLVASTREERPPGWLPAGLAHAAVPGPRKLVALRWALTGRPPVDGALGHPDLVHVLQPWTVVPSRAPLVVTVHDLMLLQHPDWYGRAEVWLHRRGLRDAVDRAERFVVNSAHTGRELTEVLGVAPDRIRVTWFGVGDELRRRPSPREAAAVCGRHRVEPGRYVIAVGQVSARKNLTTVLRALAALGPAERPVLLAAGPRGAGAAAVEAEAERLGLAEAVRWAGFVDDADLRVLLAAAGALVHPSRAEGFGLTPIEAMAAGVPALASDVGAVREVAGDAAVLLDPGDPDAWAAAIREVLGDDDRRAALVARGTAHQARFTWAATAEATRAVHDEVLGR